MFKITWSIGNDEFNTCLAIVPTAENAFDLYWALLGYGRKDNCKPFNIKVTNLDGEVIHMIQGLPSMQGKGTR